MSVREISDKELSKKLEIARNPEKAVSYRPNENPNAEPVRAIAHNLRKGTDEVFFNKGTSARYVQFFRELAFALELAEPKKFSKDAVRALLELDPNKETNPFAKSKNPLGRVDRIFTAVRTLSRSFNTVSENVKRVAQDIPAVHVETVFDLLDESNRKKARKITGI